MTQKKRSIAELEVMVIDDDEIILDITSDMLEQLGVTHIHTETRARQALQHLSITTNPPDLVIVDLYMPDVDGIELVEELARLKFAGGVIVVSGVNVEMLSLATQLAIAEGINLLAAWEKPIRIAALRSAIENELASD